MIKFRRIIVLAAFALGSLPAFAQERLKVVATFSIIADMANEVGGSLIDLTALVGPDGDAHVYQPKPQDASRLGDADVILTNGLAFEGFIDRLVAASGTAAPIVQLSRGTSTIEAGVSEDHAAASDHAHDHDEAKPEADGHVHGSTDPHAFQSVSNAMVYVANIADAFCRADATNCPTFRANARSYSDRLEALDAELRSLAASVPADRRTVITSHDAFGYFSHAYGIRFLAPEGVSTDAEASAADVARLIDQIRHDKAAAIFVETISDPRLIEQIARETGLQVGGALYSDALSPPGGPAATYVDMMRHNMRTIVGAIQGS